jgi:hypothetical protein
MTENYDAAILEEVAALKREAVKRTGFDDFGDSLFEEPLAAWVNDLSSPKSCRTSTNLRSRNPPYHTDHGRSTHRFNAFA